MSYIRSDVERPVMIRNVAVVEDEGYMTKVIVRLEYSAETSH